MYNQTTKKEIKMLDLVSFKDEFISQCRNTLGEYGPEDMRIEERMVNKAQRGTLNGLLFIKEGTNCAPTLYVEDYYKEYMRGAGIKALSHFAVTTVAESMNMADSLAEKASDLAGNSSDLVVHLLNKSRNKDYLKGVPAKDAGCDFKLIVYLECGEFGAVVTEELLKSMDVDKEELFCKAIENTQKKYPAMLCDLAESAIILQKECDNLLESMSKLAPADSGPGYVLSNTSFYWGAGALFYPGVIERVHERLDGEFYVIPSSVHELILVAAEDQDPQQMVEMIREANRTVVDEMDILANDLYICESGKLRRVSYGGIIPECGEIPC